MCSKTTNSITEFNISAEVGGVWKDALDMLSRVFGAWHIFTVVLSLAFIPEYPLKGYNLVAGEFQNLICMWKEHFGWSLEERTGQRFKQDWWQWEQLAFQVDKGYRSSTHAMEAKLMRVWAVVTLNRYLSVKCDWSVLPFASYYFNHSVYHDAMIPLGCSSPTNEHEQDQPFIVGYSPIQNFQEMQIPVSADSQFFTDLFEALLLSVPSIWCLSTPIIDCWQVGLAFLAFRYVRDSQCCVLL